MAFGPRSDRSLLLVDVSAPGAVEWISDPVQDSVTGMIRFTLRLPAIDANGGVLTGLSRLAVAYNLNTGFNPEDTMETILADSANQRVIIPVTPEQAGQDIDVEVEPLGTSGEMFFTAACDDQAE